MSGTLYICGTPIGNLEDITVRQLNTFKLVDFIACEDTRHTVRLLTHFNISKKLISYHEHNYKSKGMEIIRLLNEDNNIALVSDAGMPCISDPGSDIVRLCIENSINVTAVPGPAAFVTAYALSGILSQGFVFYGFFPQDNRTKSKLTDRLKSADTPYIFYEAPHRLIKTLKFLSESLGSERNITIVREITKIHEQVKKGCLSDLVLYYESNAPRGEIVLIIEPPGEEQLLEMDKAQYCHMDIKSHVKMYEGKGMDTKDAIRQTAKDRGLSKRQVYNEVMVKE
jgi:16S rRNA (cytidine1402-2'-O)-methyltransferase